MVYVSPMCAVMDTKKLMLKPASVLYESLWRKHLLGFQNKTFGVTGVRQRDKIQPQIKCAKKFDDDIFTTESKIMAKHSVSP